MGFCGSGIDIKRGANHFATLQSMHRDLVLRKTNSLPEQHLPFGVFCLLQCHWRMIKLLPEKIESLYLDRILLDIHNFMKAFPKELLKQKPNDMAYRTVKTLLHTLSRLVGPRVRRFL